MVKVNNDRKLGDYWNGLRYHQGLKWNNWHAVNGAFVPSAFGESNLGGNWLDPEMLGPAGVAGLSLDNRHIHVGLKDLLCSEESEGGLIVREYFDVLVGFAWPESAELKICCAEPAGKEAVSACAEPDLTFSSKWLKEDGSETPVFAPHFLTEKFEAGQQEVLTAALIAKINTHGTRLFMEMTGSFDLGVAGTRFEPRESPDQFPYALGKAWGNMFLDCVGNDADNVLCQASTEQDRAVGRNPAYHSSAMFTCNGGSNYPTKISGKSCFSKDMETNDADGCGFIAAVGDCDEVCLGGFCGANNPAMEGRGSHNVLNIYMEEYHFDWDEDDSDGVNLRAIAIAIPVGLVAFLFILWCAYKAVKQGKSTTKVLAGNEVEAATKDEA